MAKRNSLGKGLDALFIDNNTEDKIVTTLKISDIAPNKSQPRTQFDDLKLSELADSIKIHGIIQPIIVRPIDTGGYEIVAGERRWRAARRAGISEVPVIIRELDENQTLEIAIIENLQREDLTIVELALGYQNLIKTYGFTQEQVSKKLGKSRSSVANTVRILALPQPTIDYLNSGEITLGHAKALLALEDENIIIETSHKIVKSGLLVRDIEKMAAKNKNTQKYANNNLKKNTDESWGSSFYKEIEIALSTELGRKVKITSYGKKSTIELDFYNDEELSDIATRLTRSNN